VNSEPTVVEADGQAKVVTRHKEMPLFLFGALLIGLGLSIYFSGIVLSIIRLAVNFREPLREPFRSWNEAVVWYSGVPSTLGVILVAADLAFLLPGKRRRSRREALPPVTDRQVVVVLTAYNDEKSIAGAVQDFRNHPAVRRLIVVDNNSQDNTADVARRAGAQVVTEVQPGYGRCVLSLFSGSLSRRGQRADRAV
jgi:hypothetical protein